MFKSMRLTAVCSVKQNILCKQACDRSIFPAWGNCHAKRDFALALSCGAASRLRLTAVCPFSQELFCKQACDRVPD